MFFDPFEMVTSRRTRCSRTNRPHFAPTRSDELAHPAHLVQGEPGSGKTTLAMRYLLAGRARGERGLYVTLSESPEDRKRALENGFDEHLTKPVDIEVLEKLRGGLPRRAAAISSAG